MGILENYEEILESMMTIGKAVRVCLHNALTALLCLVLVVFFFLPALLLVATLPERWRRDNRLIFWLLDATYKGVVRALLVRVTIVGKKHIPPAPAIFVANHESSLDIPVMGSLMNGQPHIWYVLDRFSRTPFLGCMVRRLSVSVDQSSALKASRSLITGIRLVQGTRRNTIIFPEGGRYVDGKIHDFFSGFAIIAQKTGQPVVPVMLYNLGAILPPKSIFLRPHPLRVVIGEPFVLQPDETTEAFTARVRAWFVAQTK